MIANRRYSRRWPFLRWRWASREHRPVFGSERSVAESAAVPEPEQLVTLAESKPNFDSGSISFRTFATGARTTARFHDGHFRSYSYSLTGRGEPEQVTRIHIFRLPCAARRQASDRTPVCRGRRRDRRQPIVLIGEGFWNRKFARSRHFGTRLTLDGQPSPSLVWSPQVSRCKFGASAPRRVRSIGHGQSHS